MSCNPAIGGTAKGHLVHEIDALGGVMGELADATGIQFRLLNRSKGPAIWSSRCQSDREAYAAAAQGLVAAESAITVVEDTVVGVAARAGRVAAVVTGAGEEIGCRALVVASGTFLNGVLFTGLNGRAGGRYGEQPATGLSQAFQRLGIETGRLKTGTPPRLLRSSIDFAVLDEQPGDDRPVAFSRRTDPACFPCLPQVSCHITFTNPATHELLATGFDRSPMFTGRIQGAGPRYCPLHRGQGGALRRPRPPSTVPGAGGAGQRPDLPQRLLQLAAGGGAVGGAAHRARPGAGGGGALRLRRGVRLLSRPTRWTPRWRASICAGSTSPAR